MKWPEDAEHCVHFMFTLTALRLKDHEWSQDDIKSESVAIERVGRGEAKRSMKRLVAWVPKWFGIETAVVNDLVMAEFAMAGLRTADKMHRKKIVKAWDQ